MKVIDGKFGKKTEEQDDELTLIDKIGMSVMSMLPEDAKGNFVILADLGGDEVMIATDTNVTDAVFLLEVAKLNLIMNPINEETLH